MLVNPTVTPLRDGPVTAGRAASPFPTCAASCRASPRLRLDALDRERQALPLEAQGFLARVIQHECDHLDGGVYLDRMKDMRSLSFLTEFDRYVPHDEEPD